MYFSSIAHKMILIPLDPPFQPTVGDVGAGGGYVIFIPNRPQTSGGEIIFEIKGVTGGERGGRHHPLNFQFWRPHVDGGGVPSPPEPTDLQ